MPDKPEFVCCASFASYLQAACFMQAVLDFSDSGTKMKILTDYTLLYRAG